MKLFLDDIRSPPSDDWIVFRDVPTFLLHARNAEPTDILSLDHDLGDDSKFSGYDAIAQLEKEYKMGEIWTKGHPYIYVHSMNPVGADKMNAAIRSINAKELKL